MAKPGRPKKEIAPEKLCTLDQAEQRLRDYLLNKFHDPVIVERMAYTKQSLYNMIYKGRLERYGTKRCALINMDELLELVS